MNMRYVIGYDSTCMCTCALFQLSQELALVLVYDLLFGKGVKCGGPLKQYITNHKKELQLSVTKCDDHRMKNCTPKCKLMVSYLHVGYKDDCTK